MTDTALSPETSIYYTGIHGVTFEKIAVLIITAM
jgi:hypothetical protein